MAETITTPPRAAAPAMDDLRPSLRRLRVLIVDDSSTIRELLTQIISRDPRMEVAAAVKSGEEALAALPAVRPDVISMDIRLPGIDGLETTRRIMAERPTPIVVVAANVNDAELKISMNALRAGALSIIEKPSGGTSEMLAAFAERLCTQLSIMSQVHVVTQRTASRSTNGTARLPQGEAPPRLPMPSGVSPAKVEMIGIVASTGGPNALLVLLKNLGTVGVPILVVQHMTPCFANAFVEWLGEATGIPAANAVNGGSPLADRIYVAPADKHLTIRQRRLRLDDGPMVCLQRPSGTVLLESMARDLGPAAVGIVLTGMGADGAQGLQAIRSAGGYTICEHESTAVVYGMPGAAVALGAACETLPLPHIAPRIRQLVKPRPGER